MSKEAALKELSHFLTLPGGDIVPGAVDELWKIYRNPGRPSSAEQRRRGVMVREGVPLTKGEIKRVMGKSALAARLSDSDLARLKEIERGDQSGGGKNWNRKAFRKSLCVCCDVCIPVCRAFFIRGRNRRMEHTDR